MRAQIIAGIVAVVNATTDARERPREAERLPADARLGAIELTVGDLERSLRFYTEIVGLERLDGEGGVARLGAGGEELAVLHEAPGARRPGREAGLYHFALLYPTRTELARAAARIARGRSPIDGASDHGTHEAIYLPDPDGIGVELAADRPREQWPDLRQAGADFFSNGPQPLDVRGLIESVAFEEPRRGVAAGLRVGHVHLHVGDLEAATRFYRDGLGFEVMAELPTAAFVSFGGYHHHVAFNLWRGRGIPAAADEQVIGLRHWTLELARAQDRAALERRLRLAGAPVQRVAGGLMARDPANIAVRVGG